MGDDLQRAVYYPPTDLACMMSKARVQQVLEAFPEGTGKGINDAIELYQCNLFMSAYASAFDDVTSAKLTARSAKAKGFSYKLIRNLAQEHRLDDLYDSVDMIYRSRFWDLLENSLAYEAINGDEFLRLLDTKPSALYAVLTHKRLVKHFDATIRASMLRHPTAAAQIIIQGCAARTNQAPIVLPKSLVNADMDSIMLQYLQSPKPNVNYTQLLAAWPSSTTPAYLPSADVRVAARRRTAELNNALLAESSMAGFSFRVEVSINETQAECLRVQSNKTLLHVQVRQSWLDEYTDYPTILTNLIWIFGLVDPHGRIRAAAHQHERSTLLATLGLHSKQEYPQTIRGMLYGNCQHLSVRAYRSFLQSKGIRLESVLEWCFNESFPQEFGVQGLGISLPSGGTTYFDRCKAMGTELERIAKGYILLKENGSIDPEYFSFKRFDGWREVPSLVQDKYAVAGARFDNVAWQLFSDQCLLAYVPETKDSYDSFFDAMLATSPTREDYHEAMHPAIDALLEMGLITEEPDGSLAPTLSACALQQIWHEGAIVMPRVGKHDKHDRETIESLVASEVVEYRSTLLAPDEADYFDYMLNNSRFSDSPALRNTYDHATMAVDDPNASKYENDYVRFLELLSLLALKINDDLMLSRRSGVELDLIDTPYLATSDV